MAARRAARDDAREAPQIEAREQAAAALDLGGRKDCASSRRFERGSAASRRGLVRARVWLHDLALLAQPSAVAASDPDTEVGGVLSKRIEGCAHLREWLLRHRVDHVARRAETACRLPNGKGKWAAAIVHELERER